MTRFKYSLGLLGVSALVSQGARANELKLSAKSRLIVENNANYKECISTATSHVKDGIISVNGLPQALEKCRDRYPGAAFFLECKKKVLSQAQGTELNADAVAACKKVLSFASFEPEQPVPLYATGAQAFFGGVGINQVWANSELSFPPYNCSKYQDSLANIPSKAQHILFGNHPQVFAAAAQQAGLVKTIDTMVSRLKKTDKYVDVPLLGRLFGEARSPEAVLYFPAANCDFQGDLGKIFSAMSLYLLPDITAKSAFPYFGIAYYQKTQTEVTVPAIVAEVLKRLGPRYKAYAKNKETVFVSAAAFQEVDGEKDPRNICKPPRGHQFVAIVHSQAEKPTVPEYLILANIGKLCEYGDRMVARLTSK